ncbi:MAG: hypothetical protein RLZZ546_2170 [Bacteroidota bacterium]|jgi:hypothetical protein
MLLNKLRLYNPKPSKGATSPNGEIPLEVINEEYNTSWSGDINHAPSRDDLFNKIESLGYFGNVVIVDKTYGNDYTGRVGNINKPFYSHSVAIGSIPAGSPGLCITMPGVYQVNSSFGFPIKNGIDHYLFNATIEVCSGSYSYGSILVYPNYVKCKIYGKGTIKNLSVNQDWALITPYVSCDLEFEGIRFEGPKQIIGNAGGFNQAKKLKFRNCELVSTNNTIPTYLGAGNFAGYTQAVFENCYIKGCMLVTTSNSGFFPDNYLLKFYRCHFESIDTNSNGQYASISFLDYYSDAQISKYLFQDCSFTGNHNNLYCADGYGGAGSNKYIIINNCRFVNGVEGWIVNNNPNYKFKLTNSWTTNNASGSPVTNLMSGTGMITDPNLEIENYE